MQVRQECVRILKKKGVKSQIKLWKKWIIFYFDVKIFTENCLEELTKFSYWPTKRHHWPSKARRRSRIAPWTTEFFVSRPPPVSCCFALLGCQFSFYFCYLRGGFRPCQSVRCGKCYTRKDCNKFKINEPLDDNGLPMYEDNDDEQRYKVGVDGAQFMVPFQCDLCIFRTLFKRNPLMGPSDTEALQVIRRMNLDIIWSREPSNTSKNIWNPNNIITTCEASGFEPSLPPLGPLPFEDIYRFSVAFAMIIH